MSDEFVYPNDIFLEKTGGGIFKKEGALILYFYPRDNTPGCISEAESFKSLYPEFKQLNIEIAGVSLDSIQSHEKFAKKLALPFPLLSDSEEKLSLYFDVIKLKNMYGKQFRGIERSTFLINSEDKIIYSWRKVKVNNHAQEVLLMCQKLIQ